jgi:hypothetical protein
METSEASPLLGELQNRASQDQTSALDIEHLPENVAVFQPSSKGSPIERDLVYRLDVFLMTFGCISQIIK